MTLTTTKTVGEVAAEAPASTRVFEELGIDYCCGGKQSLGDACQNAKITVDDLLARLAAAQEEQQRRGDTSARWDGELLSRLIVHIVDTHHAYVRRELPRLNALADKVAGVHGKNHAELFQVKDLLAALTTELDAHMMKEEQVLFPYVVQMEEAVTRGQTPPPAFFGTVQNPIRMMIQEHDGAGEMFTKMNELSGRFTTPADGCASYQAYYQGLAEFERDLHQHIHLENNILFPRAVAMEQGQER